MLDYLQNPPIKHSLMQKLIAIDSPNYFALTPNALQKIQQDKEDGDIRFYGNRTPARYFGSDIGHGI